jgi:UDP-N-acetylglucosamine--N-acetylmuramyl-(pentapeptide) pyrophosphoryl-undecaprenol N-acetylglucosamine transferase
MTEAITQFGCEEVQFIWMTGHSDAHGARDAAGKAPCRVEVFPFINDMAAACAAADFVVGRAGASSTAEIAMLGKPSLLVPYPFATDNHQEQNARAFEQAGAAIILLDEECTGARLADALKSVLRDPVRLQQMSRSAASLARPGAAEAIVDEILLLAFTKSGTDYELR